MADEKKKDAVEKAEKKAKATKADKADKANKPKKPNIFVRATRRSPAFLRILGAKSRRSPGLMRKPCSRAPAL